MVIKVGKLAVFDLDGTLYKVNSHIEVLNMFYKGRYRTFFFRLWALFFPNAYQKHINKAFSKIDQDFIESVYFERRESAINLLKLRINEGFYPVIVSNAPVEIVELAGKYFNIDFRRTDIAMKHLALNDFEYKELFVCTDNVTDLDILSVADFSVIYVKESRKKEFSIIKNAIFLEE